MSTETMTAPGIVMNEKVTEKIRLWGIVQGVGFRPFVAGLARKMGLTGEVLNTGGLVEIILTAEEEQISRFLRRLKEEKPEPAELVHIRRERIPFRSFSGFAILDSEDGGGEAVMIPADLAMCPSCEKELFDPENPRFRHPMISCMVCGPRFTIMNRLPYDRDTTTMEDFPMCGFCREQYTDPGNRRYHAQTISCHGCGPRIRWEPWDGPAEGPEREREAALSRQIAERTECFGAENNRISQINDDIEKERRRGSDGTACQKRRDIEKNIFDRGVRELARGRILAVKGAGGYHLVCDPFHPEAAAVLRSVKGREAKPFAVMFRDSAQIREYCLLSEQEQKLAESSARPILLLEKKEQPLRRCAEWEKDRFVGAFLPGIGFQYLLLSAWGGPLIFTSANPSGLPMIKEDKEMRQWMRKEEGRISAMISNDRRILRRVDDSVVRMIDGQPQMIRRSKGYVPVPVYIGNSRKDADVSPGGSVFAAGGQLKNAFALTKGAFAYISPFFGDLESAETEEIYRQGREEMESLFRIRPEAAVCDLHPLYRTTALAEAYAAERKIPLIRVQHHHAHVASVMAEHGLTGPVIGVSFDGTGYGSDGLIWGGEILLCREGDFQRFSHLKYVSMIGGDGSVREGWKSAMCYAFDRERPDGKEPEEDEFTADLTEMLERSGIRRRPEWALVRRALETEVNTIRSASMGRLFDAAASLLGICHENRYEGECAIALEAAAERARKREIRESVSGEAAPVPNLSAGIGNGGGNRPLGAEENEAGKDAEKDRMALDFHRQITRIILTQCEAARQKTGINQVALTGGVFQNKILMEESLELLRNAGFQVYYNISVSPNDGGIALGQAFIALHRLREAGRKEEKACPSKR